MSSPPSSCTASGDQLLAERLVAQVAGDGHALAPLGLDQLDDLARIGLLVRQVVDRDVGALAGEGDGRGPAHAGIAAGDQRLAAGQPARAVIARLAMVGPRLHLAGETRPGLRLRLNGGFGYLAAGSTIGAAVVAAAAWAVVVAAAARPAVAAPTALRRDIEMLGSLFMPAS